MDTNAVTILGGDIHTSIYSENSISLKYRLCEIQNYCLIFFKALYFCTHGLSENEENSDQTSLSSAAINRRALESPSKTRPHAL